MELVHSYHDSTLLFLLEGETITADSYHDNGWSRFVGLATQTEYLHLYWGVYVNGTVLTIKGEYCPNRITS
jgi:hypothetical protein